jgi:hypothetical protein
VKVLQVKPNDPVLVTCQDPETQEPKAVLVTFVYKPSGKQQKTSPLGGNLYVPFQRIFGLKVSEIAQAKENLETLTCDFVQKPEGSP